MNRRVVKTIVIAASVAGLSGLACATASADTFTPGIEEPTTDLGLPNGAQDLTGGGNHSSAVGRNGKSYGADSYRAGGYGADSYGSDGDGPDNYGAGSYADHYSHGRSSHHGDPVDDRSDRGYWRDSGGDSN